MSVSRHRLIDRYHFFSVVVVNCDNLIAFCCMLSITRLDFITCNRYGGVNATNMTELKDIISELICSKIINFFRYNVKDRSYLNDNYELLAIIYYGNELHAEYYKNKVRTTYFALWLSLTSYCKFLAFWICCQVLIVRCSLFFSWFVHFFRKMDWYILF